MRVNVITEQGSVTETMARVPAGFAISITEESAVLMWPWHLDEDAVQQGYAALEAMGYTMFVSFGSAEGVNGCEHEYVVAVKP